MKILQLRFKNLNSLYGEWIIDFTSKEYLASSIFAITGPTGAGKSTILDGICLALYGQTPRLGKISQGGNEIMSRQTGECFAEVTFLAQEKSYRCHWSQHRAFKKASGKLADSKHEIADASSGQILESKKRNVAAVIEEKTGMDFDRFTRSILLAQGGFAAFLQASSDERAPILEQITGTEIYSEISKKVHERQREEQEKLKLLQAETAGITLLSQEQQTALEAELDKQEQFKKKLIEEQQKITKAITWLSGIDTLRLELVTLDQEITQVKGTISAFSGERKKLQQAQKAAELSGEFATLYSLRNQQKEDQRALDENERKVPPLVSLLLERDQLLAKATLSVAMAKKALKAEGPLIKKVRALDLQLVEKQKLIKIAASDCQNLTEQVAKTKKERGRLVSKRQELQVQFQSLEKYFESHRVDELLVEQLGGIAEQLKSLQLCSAEYISKSGAVKQQRQKVEAAVTSYGTQQKLFSEKKNQHQAAQKKVAGPKETFATLLSGRLLREYRADRDSLMREMVYLRKISDLEGERKRLVAGKSCPLCGATEHPWALGNIPGIDPTEKRIAELTAFIVKAEQLDGRIRELEEKETIAAQLLSTTEKQLAQLEYRKGEADRELARVTGELSDSKSGFIKLQQAVLQNLQPFGVEQVSEQDISKVLLSLTERRKRWQDYQVRKVDIEKTGSGLDSEIKELDGVLAVYLNSLKEHQQHLAGRKKESDLLLVDRGQLYQTKKPDKEEVRLEEMVAKAENAEKVARDEKDIASKQLDTIKTLIGSLNKNLVKRKQVLETTEHGFVKLCLEKEFVDETAFIACRLSALAMQQLTQRAQDIDAQEADLLSRKKDRETRLAEERRKALCEITLEELLGTSGKLEENLKEKAEGIGALKQQLLEDKAAKNKLKERLGLLEGQKAELLRWQNLHLMIGSADGKKYRNFAQGITFELMVSHANRQLVKLTDRYLLLRDREQPLELNVIDNYQAGEVRSTKNLSGGECFLVSLSLALGLSKMASRKVPVDSLFLDEGFGTLDEESLDTALETLAGLQQDGKLIGVISHVPGLKERISSQIEVSPLSGGKSTITGPGCIKVKG